MLLVKKKKRTCLSFQTLLPLRTFIRPSLSSHPTSHNHHHLHTVCLETMVTTGMLLKLNCLSAGYSSQICRVADFFFFFYFVLFRVLVIPPWQSAVLFHLGCLISLWSWALQTDTIIQGTIIGEFTITRCWKWQLRWQAESISLSVIGGVKSKESDMHFLFILCIEWLQSKKTCNTDYKLCYIKIIYGLAKE